MRSLLKRSPPGRCHVTPAVAIDGDVRVRAGGQSSDVGEWACLGGNGERQGGLL